MKMFRAKPMFCEITEVEVEKESNLSVWIKGRVNRKRTDYESYHPTWSEAKAAIVEDITMKVDSASRTLAHLKDRLAKAESLKQTT